VRGRVERVVLAGREARELHGETERAELLGHRQGCRHTAERIIARSSVEARAAESDDRADTVRRTSAACAGIALLPSASTT
jgi:hypothetical protein